MQAKDGRKEKENDSAGWKAILKGGARSAVLSAFRVAMSCELCYNTHSSQAEETPMESMTVACVQQRMSIPATHKEFEAEARRFLRQTQAKGVRLTVFPELAGVMLAPPLISGLKLGFIKREDAGKKRDAGFLSRRLGSLAGTTASAMGGGFRGSLERLLQKKSDVLADAYAETFGRLAREFGTSIVAGSLYLYDEETGTVRNRAYFFDAAGEVQGHQDKFNLHPDERQFASPGSELNVFDTRYGRFGLLIGRDILYPELGRMLAAKGADLLVGISASHGSAQANVIRSALAMRAEENQVFAAASFLLGPDYLTRDVRADFYGQSAILAPISLTQKGDGLLMQAGTDHTEGLVATELDLEALYNLRQISGFRPRQEMNLGNLRTALADFYQQGLTIQQAIDMSLSPLAEEAPEEAPEEAQVGVSEGMPQDQIFGPVPLDAEPPDSTEEAAPQASEPESAGAAEVLSVPEALSLGGEDQPGT
jgi:predicted amidohydrolase